MKYILIFCMLLIGCEYQKGPDTITYISQISTGSPELEAIYSNPGYKIVTMKPLGQSVRNGRTMFMYEFQMKKDR